eukprot:scaffold34484_cov63-Phaeocystis_antarctica.AAC.1
MEVPRARPRPQPPLRGLSFQAQARGLSYQARPRPGAARPRPRSARPEALQRSTCEIRSTLEIRSTCVNLEIRQLSLSAATPWPRPPPPRLLLPPPPPRKLSP